MRRRTSPESGRIPPARAASKARARRADRRPTAREGAERTMAAYVLRRVAVSVALLILSSILIFCLMRVIPGDPTITKVASAGQSHGASERTLRAVRREL